MVWAFSSTGVIGVVEVVGAVEAVGLVGVAAGPQAAITRDNAIRLLTASHRIFLLIYIFSLGDFDDIV